MLKDEIIFIDYVKLEVNLTDPLTKPFGRKLNFETSIGMGLKANFKKLNFNKNLTYVIGDPTKEINMGNNKSFVNTVSIIKLVLIYSISTARLHLMRG